MNTKFERLSINLLRRDKDTLRQLAYLAGEAMSVVMRRLVRQEARRLGLLGQGIEPQTPTDDQTGGADA